MKFDDPCVNLFTQIPPLTTLTVLDKFQLKPSEAAFSTVFFRCSFRLQVVSNVMSAANVGRADVDVPVKFDDSSSNCSRDIQQQGHQMGHFRPFFELL